MVGERHGRRVLLQAPPISAACDPLRHWLYLRFALSFRHVEEMLAERGIDVSRGAVRYWVIKFGPRIAANLRRRRSSPTGRWHLDEMIVKIAGRRMISGLVLNHLNGLGLVMAGRYLARGPASSQVSLT